MSDLVTPDIAPTAARRALRRPITIVGVFLAWTLFVWVGRVRNAFGDDTLTSAEQRSALVLAISFVVPAIVVLVALVLFARSGTTASAPRTVVRIGVWALGLWTLGLWSVRVIDIAFLSDHDVGFVVVHAVLAVVSVALAVAAIRAIEAAITTTTRQRSRP